MNNPAPPNPTSSPDSSSSSNTSNAGSSFRSSIKSFLSGGVGGIAAVLVGHPFDLIKVRMQTGTVGSTNVGVFGALSKTLRSEGVRGLYRGVSAPLVASTPIYAISFWGYDVGQTLVYKFLRSQGEDKMPLTIPEIMLAGGFSALPMIIVMAPTERIKCLLQVQTNTNNATDTKGGKAPPPKYTGMIDCGTKIYKEGGIRSVYKGTMLTMMRDVPGSIAWFGTYEIIKRSLVEWQGIDDPSHLSPLAVMTAGGFAGMACWGSSIMPDNLKSRFQTAPEGKFRGAADVYRAVVKEQGYGALFTGFRPAMIRECIL